MDVNARAAPASALTWTTPSGLPRWPPGPPEDPYADYIDDADAVETVLAMLGGRILSMA